ncbi:hypothetical protein BaRGS_00025059, partial [Batillaria attramentaria]
EDTYTELIVLSSSEDTYTELIVLSSSEDTYTEVEPQWHGTKQSTENNLNDSSSTPFPASRRQILLTNFYQHGCGLNSTLSCVNSTHGLKKRKVQNTSCLWY